MKVIGFEAPGEPDVLKPYEIDDPEPQSGEVLIRIHAAAVNPTDAMRRAGQRPPGGDGQVNVPGMDAAGVVEALGPDTDTDLRPGDDVMAVVVPQGSHGAYSEKISLPTRSVSRVPKGAGYAKAASLPMNGLTARMALDTLNLRPGQVVAVTGAAGALGGYVIQLAKQDGLTVVADAAEADERLVSDLGADVVLRRGDGFTDLVRERFPDGVDGLVDGALLLDAAAPAVRDNGTVITIRGYDEAGERGIRFQPILVVNYAEEHDKLDQLRRLAESGDVSLRVADTLPAEQASEAHRRLAQGGVRGRLVLTFQP